MRARFHSFPPSPFADRVADRPKPGQSILPREGWGSRLRERIVVFPSHDEAILRGEPDRPCGRGGWNGVRGWAHGLRGGCCRSLWERRLGLRWRLLHDGRGRRAGRTRRGADLDVAFAQFLRDELVGLALRGGRVGERFGLRLARGPDAAEVDDQRVVLALDGPELLRGAGDEMKFSKLHGGIGSGRMVCPLVQNSSGQRCGRGERKTCQDCCC